MDQFELATTWIINYTIVYTRMLSECKRRVIKNDSISLEKGTSEFTKRQRIVPNIHDASI